MLSAKYLAGGMAYQKQECQILESSIVSLFVMYQTILLYNNYIILITCFVSQEHLAM